MGFHEIAGWGFVPRPALAALGDDVLAAGLAVRNPISADYEVMRTSLLPGLADAARRNLARGIADVRLFEVGPVIHPVAGDDHHRQFTVAAGLAVGHRAGWLKPAEGIDFFDVKQTVLELAHALGIGDLVFAPPSAATRPAYLHPGVSAELRSAAGTADTGRLGLVGELHPAVARRLGIEAQAFYFELELDALGAAAAAVRASSPPRFPAVSRDISFWIDAATPAAAQQSAMRATGEPLLVDVAVLEDFRDPRFTPAGKKGMLWTLTYRAPERTLTDPEVDAAHTRIVAALGKSFEIQIR